MSFLSRFRVLLWVLALVVASSCLSAIAVTRGPWRFYTKDFLFGDSCVSLLVASELNHGHVLYKDVAYPYGWIPAVIYALFTRAFGNTISVYFVFHTILSLLNISLLFLALKRSLSAADSAAFVVFWMFPSLVIPAAIVAGYSNSLYLPAERLLLTSSLLIWSHPGHRSWKRAAGLGAILGIWQGVKFGGAIFGGAAYFLLDLACLAASSDRPKAFKHWIRSGLVTAGVFLSIEAIQAAGAFAILPKSVAWDFLWPSYTAKLYETIAPESKVVLAWHGFLYFVVQQLPFLLGIAASLAVSARVIFRSSREGPSRDQPALLLLVVFYVVAAAGGYFGHVHTYYKYSWCLLIPIAAFAGWLPGKWRWLVWMMAAPGLFLLVRTAVFPRFPENVSPFTIPTGEVLYVPSKERATIGRVLDEVKAADGKTVLIVPLGSGVHALYGVRTFSRYTWYIPYYIRPYDNGVLQDNVSTLGVFVNTAVEGDDPLAPFRDPRLFPPEMSAALLPHLKRPTVSADGYATYRVE